MAADTLGWNVVGYISIEKSKVAARTVDYYFPGSVLVEDVQAVDFEMVKQ